MTTFKSLYNFLQCRYSMLATSILMIILKIYLFSAEIHAQEIVELVEISKKITIDNEEEIKYLIPELWHYLFPELWDLIDETKQDIKENYIWYSLLGIYVIIMVMTDTTIQ